MSSTPPSTTQQASPLTPATPTSPTSPVLPSASLSVPSPSATGGLEADIARLQKGFRDLVELVENSFLANQVSLDEIKKSIKHIPVTLKHQLSDCFREEFLNLIGTKRIEELVYR